MTFDYYHHYPSGEEALDCWEKAAAADDDETLEASDLESERDRKHGNKVCQTVCFTSMRC